MATAFGFAAGLTGAGDFTFAAGLTGARGTGFFAVGAGFGAWALAMLADMTTGTPPESEKPGKSCVCDPSALMR